jgi:sulfofructose kinase
MTDKRFDVLGIGIVTVDDLLYLDHYPAPDSKMPVRARQRQGGGLTGTALVASARLGASTAFFGVLGEDELSTFTLREFEREEVDCSMVLRRADASPLHSIIMIDQSNGQRVILFSTDLNNIPRPEEVTLPLVSCCRVLVTDHVAGLTGIQAARLARSAGIPVVADIERSVSTYTAEFLSLVNHLIVGREMAHQLTGENEPARMVKALSSTQRDATVVTAGVLGCWYCLGEGPVSHMPAMQVQVVDTTGCGDVFHGAYAASLAQGESILRAVQVATVTAGLKASYPGGRSGIPRRAEVDRVLASWQPE